MIGDCKLTGRGSTRCAGHNVAQRLISNEKSVPIKYLFQELGRYYWEHSEQVGTCTQFWYCRECHTELLFQQIKKER